MSDHELVINDLSGYPHARLTITVRHTKRFSLRVWLAVRLIRFAAWVAPVGVDVNERQQPGDDG